MRKNMYPLVQKTPLVINRKIHKSHSQLAFEHQQSLRQSEKLLTQYRTQKFNTMFTRPYHWSSTWTIYKCPHFTLFCAESPDYYLTPVPIIQTIWPKFFINLWFLPCPIHKVSNAYHEGTAPLIHNLGTRWMWVVKFTSWPLHCWCALNMRLKGPSSGLDALGEKEKF